MNEHMNHSRRGRFGRRPFGDVDLDDARFSRGPRGPRGPWGRGPGGGRMRRGDVRLALLAVLLDGPGHGYELIQRLEAKTDGAWAPSPGSVYPTLQLLEDEDLVVATERDGKRVVELTDAGRAQAEERLAADGEPWAEFTGGPGAAGDLRSGVQGLMHAARQVATTGTPESIERAAAIVTQARKDLYLLLAEG